MTNSPTFPLELLEAAERRHRRVAELLDIVLVAATELDELGIALTGVAGDVVTAEATAPVIRRDEDPVPAGELAGLLERGKAHAIRGVLTIDDASPTTWVAIAGPAVDVAEADAVAQRERDKRGTPHSPILEARAEDRGYRGQSPVDELPGEHEPPVRAVPDADEDAAGADGSPASGAPSQAAPAPAASPSSPPDLELLPDPPAEEPEPAADEPAEDEPAGDAATAPADVDHLDLTDTQRLVYEAFDGETWRSVGDVRRATNLSFSALGRAIRKLRELELLEHNGKPTAGAKYRRRGVSTCEACGEPLDHHATPCPLDPEEHDDEPAPAPAPPPARSSSAIPTTAGETQAAVYAAIADHGLTVPELTYGLRIPRDAVNAAINYLVQRGYAKQAPEPRRDGFQPFIATRPLRELA